MNQSRKMIHSLAEFAGVIHAVTSKANGHAHMIEIPSIVAGGGPNGMRIITDPAPTDGHIHTVEITADDLTRFHAGESVTVKTSETNHAGQGVSQEPPDHHTHSLTFDNTMEPITSPKQDADEGSINVLGKLPLTRAGKRKKKPTRSAY